jgi:hypothetical protein
MSKETRKRGTCFGQEEQVMSGNHTKVYTTEKYTFNRRASQPTNAIVVVVVVVGGKMWKEEKQASKVKSGGRRRRLALVLCRGPGPGPKFVYVTEFWENICFWPNS